MMFNRSLTCFRCHFSNIQSISRSAHHATSQINLKSRYGGRNRVTVLEGDGVGPEMLQHVRNVIKACNVPVDFESVAISRNSDSTTFEEALLSCKRNGIAIKGNIDSLRPGDSKARLMGGVISRNLQLRVALDLFAFVQRCKDIPGVQTRHKDVDFVVIRENTEGEYSSLENESVPGVVHSLKIITEAKTRKVAKYAFDYAILNKREKVTIVHKANIMKMADGLFLETCKEVAKLYPSIEVESMIVDNCCMQLVSRPQQFDVMLMPNLYGNVIGNIGAGLTGGAGLTSGMNIGQECAVFESGTRNSASNLVGKNVANPGAMLFAACDMLEHLGYLSHAGQVRKAILKTIGDKAIRTPDLGGSNTTTDVVESVIDQIEV